MNETTKRAQRLASSCTYVFRGAGIASGMLIAGFSSGPSPHSPGIFNRGYKPKARATATVAPEPSSSAMPLPSQAFGRLLSSPTLYRIAWGDTLNGIRRKFGLGLGPLMRANHLSSDIIYAGTTLIIPGIYQVGDHASWRAIASSQHMRVDQLKWLNLHVSGSLAAGQRLAIVYDHAPVAATTPPASKDPSDDALPIHAPTPSSLSPQDVQLLAHLVQAEAGNQPFLGQVAVAAVALNRLKAPGFPKSLKQVIDQPGQFQCVTNGTISNPPSQQAWLAAKSALNGVDPSQGALYYYNPSLTRNQWIRSQPQVVEIGQQVFAR